MVKDENNKIDRINYEVSVLEELRKQLRCKSIWIEGAYRYRNPVFGTYQDGSVVLILSENLSLYSLFAIFFELRIK
jgi:hypothetical protein